MMDEETEEGLQMWGERSGRSIAPEAAEPDLLVERAMSAEITDDFVRPRHQ
jgi:hypothetical protein